MLLLDFCDDALVLTIMYFLKIIIEIAFILVPIVLLVMLTIDIVKAVIHSDDNALKEIKKIALKRIIMSVIIFFVPTIITLLMDIIDFKTYDKCVKEATWANVTAAREREGIKREQEEKERKEKEEEERKKAKSEEEKKEQQNKDNGNNSGNDGKKEKLDGVETGGHDKYSSTAGLNYYLYVPQNPTKNMPLVIFLHGIGEHDNLAGVKILGPVTSITNGTMSELENFIFMAPVAKNTGWHDSNTWPSLITLIDEVSIQYNINTSRIYLTGFSAGGNGVWGIVNKYPDKFRAAVPVSGYYYIDGNNFKNVPVRALVGTGTTEQNTFAANMQTNVDKINNAGGKAELKTISDAGGEHVAVQAHYSTKELYQWLLSNK